jgi:hypothetical protein
MVGQTLGRTNVDWKKISRTNAGGKKVAPKITLLFNLKIEKLKEIYQDKCFQLIIIIIATQS